MLSEKNNTFEMTVSTPSQLHFLFFLLLLLQIGVSHDGENNNYLNYTGHGSIMATIIYYKLTKYHWSTCSKLQMYENLKVSSPEISQNL